MRIRVSQSLFLSFSINLICLRQIVRSNEVRWTTKYANAQRIYNWLQVSNRECYSYVSESARVSVYVWCVCECVMHVCPVSTCNGTLSANDLLIFMEYNYYLIPILSSTPTSYTYLFTSILWSYITISFLYSFFALHFTVIQPIPKYSFVQLINSS